MFVRVRLVLWMGMIVRSMFSRVIVIMELFRRTMHVLVLMLVQVLMGVRMGVLVGMSFPPMGVDMRMGMGMLVGMMVTMFMIAFHGISLLSISLQLPLRASFCTIRTRTGRINLSILHENGWKHSVYLFGQAAIPKKDGQGRFHGDREGTRGWPWKHPRPCTDRGDISPGDAHCLWIGVPNR